MNTFQVFSTDDARVECSFFSTERGVQEAHLLIHVTQNEKSFQQQLQAVQTAFEVARQHWGTNMVPVMERYFLSDAINQEALVWQSAHHVCALSIVQQPPLDGTKVALWVYGLANVTVENLTDGLFAARSEHFTHLWLSQATACGDTIGEQTHHILEHYVHQLKKHDCTLASHCVRTWFFVDDIDHQYTGFVGARNSLFDREGLTPDTHFIASTGIGGRTGDVSTRVMMDAYAVYGMHPKQITHLYALDHLNRTSDYGVRFERGTAIDYTDRRLVFISGTASINHLGEVVAPGDIRQQTQRMWENVKALLAEARMDFTHLAQLLVYLRDPSDYAVVHKMFTQQFPSTPFIILLAPVCRPSWLIEMECVAVKSNE